MIDTLVNLVFRCSHRKLTRPITLRGEPGALCTDTYVVCLDCGKQFAYDREEGRVMKRGHPPKTAPSWTPQHT
jgi:hypothetical protein